MTVIQFFTQYWDWYLFIGFWFAMDYWLSDINSDDTALERFMAGAFGFIFWPGALVAKLRNL
jgi:hypothetical protein